MEVHAERQQGTRNQKDIIYLDDSRSGFRLGRNAARVAVVLERDEFKGPKSILEGVPEPLNWFFYDAGQKGETVGAVQLVVDEETPGGGYSDNPDDDDGKVYLNPSTPVIRARGLLRDKRASTRDLTAVRSTSSRGDWRWALDIRMEAASGGQQEGDGESVEIDVRPTTGGGSGLGSTQPSRVRNYSEEIGKTDKPKRFGAGHGYVWDGISIGPLGGLVRLAPQYRRDSSKDGDQVVWPGLRHDVYFDRGDKSGPLHIRPGDAAEIKEGEGKMAKGFFLYDSSKAYDQHSAQIVPIHFEKQIALPEDDDEETYPDPDGIPIPGGDESRPRTGEKPHGGSKTGRGDLPEGYKDPKTGEPRPQTGGGKEGTEEPKPPPPGGGGGGQQEEEDEEEEEKKGNPPKQPQEPNLRGPHEQQVPGGGRGGSDEPDPRSTTGGAGGSRGFIDPREGGFKPLPKIPEFDKFRPEGGGSPLGKNDPPEQVGKGYPCCMSPKHPPADPRTGKTIKPDVDCCNPPKDARCKYLCEKAKILEDDAKGIDDEVDKAIDDFLDNWLKSKGLGGGVGRDGAGNRASADLQRFKKETNEIDEAAHDAEAAAQGHKEAADAARAEAKKARAAKDFDSENAKNAEANRERLKQKKAEKQAKDARKQIEKREEKGRKAAEEFEKQKKKAEKAGKKARDKAQKKRDEAKRLRKECQDRCKKATEDLVLRSAPDDVISMGGGLGQKKRDIKPICAQPVGAQAKMVRLSDRVEIVYTRSPTEQIQFLTSKVRAMAERDDAFFTHRNWDYYAGNVAAVSVNDQNLKGFGHVLSQSLINAVPKGEKGMEPLRVFGTLTSSRRFSQAQTAIGAMLNVYGKAIGRGAQITDKRDMLRINHTTIGNAEFLGRFLNINRQGLTVSKDTSDTTKTRLTTDNAEARQAFLLNRLASNPALTDSIYEKDDGNLYFYDGVTEVQLNAGGTDSFAPDVIVTEADGGAGLVAALAAAEAGDWIHLETGTYTVESDVLVDTPGVAITGGDSTINSVGGVDFQVAAFGVSMFDIIFDNVVLRTDRNGLDANPTERFVGDHLEFRNQTGTRPGLQSSTGISQCYLSRLWFRGSVEQSVEIAGGITDCEFHDVLDESIGDATNQAILGLGPITRLLLNRWVSDGQSAGSYSLFISSDDTEVIEDLTIRDCAFLSPPNHGLGIATGIGTTLIDGILIDGCTFSGTTTALTAGLEISVEQSTNTIGVVVRNCRFRSNVIDIQWAGGTSSLQDCVLTGNAYDSVAGVHSFTGSEPTIVRFSEPGRILVSDGGFGFDSEPDSRVYLQSAGIIAISSDGSDTFLVAGDGIRVGGHIHGDDMDGTPVADRLLEVNDGVWQAQTTGGVEGRYISRSSLESVDLIRTTTGPTDLSVGAIADGEFLKRSGSSIIGGTAGGGSEWATLVYGGDNVDDGDSWLAWNDGNDGNPASAVTATTINGPTPWAGTIDRLVMLVQVSSSLDQAQVYVDEVSVYDSGTGLSIAEDAAFEAAPGDSVALDDRIAVYASSDGGNIGISAMLLLQKSSPPKQCSHPDCPSYGDPDKRCAISTDLPNGSHTYWCECCDREVRRGVWDTETGLLRQIMADVTDPDNVTLCAGQSAKVKLDAGRTLIPAEMHWSGEQRPKLRHGNRRAYRGGRLIEEPIPDWVDKHARKAELRGKAQRGETLTPQEITEIIALL